MCNSPGSHSGNQSNETLQVRIARAVVELSFFQRIAQLVVFRRFAGGTTRNTWLDFRNLAARLIGRPCIVGQLLSTVMVSPTLAAASSLMPQMTKPTSPAFSEGRSTDFWA